MKKLIVLLFLVLSLTVSAEAFKVPDKIVAAIKKNAAKTFPDDFMTQAFVIKNQKESYEFIQKFIWDKRVSAEIRNKIKAKAYKQFGKGNDFMTMLFVMKQQQEAYLKIL